MEFAGLAPKKNCGDTKETLHFVSVEEGVRALVKDSRGAKILFLSDKNSYFAVAPVGKGARSLHVVLDGAEVSSLFSMPEVTLVVAAGEAYALRAARYFAKVRRLPCALFPVSPDLDGVFEREGELCVGERTRVFFGCAEVFCDQTLMRKNGKRAYARLLLSRLALIEGRALRAFGRRIGCPEAEEGLYSRLVGFSEADLRTVAEHNAFARTAERDGAYAGEGAVFARFLRERGVRDAEWQSYFCLLSLYRAFFKRGKPRRYFVPDYRARTERAGGVYREAEIPTAEEYAQRCMALEKIRKEYFTELDLLYAKTGEHRRNLRAYSDGLNEKGGAELLRYLPELGGGLSAVMRDFGLMEEI